MKARHFITGLLTAFCLSSCQSESPAETSTVTQSAWAKLFVETQAQGDIIGMSGLVLRDGKTAEHVVAGVRQYGKPAAISKDQVWHIGSITKSMTSTLLARLTERDLISWDTKISDVLGAENIHEKWRDITLTQLVTHTSGAQANFDFTVAVIHPATPEDTLKERREAVMDILAKPPELEPDSKMHYSNVGYTIAGVLAEEITGQSWETLMQQEVFNPLGLTSAGFGAPKGKMAAWGHRGKLPMNPETDMADNSPVMGPAGTVHMTLQDLARYGQAHVDGLNGKSDYLSQESFETLHQPILEDYAKGWMAPGEKMLPGTIVSWHNGSNTMWYAFLMILSEDNTVFAMAANDGNIQAVDAAFGILTQDYYAKMKETE